MARGGDKHQFKADGKKPLNGTIYNADQGSILLLLPSQPKPSNALSTLLIQPPTTSTSSTIMAPKIAIVFYSMYGHIKTLAEAEAKGIEAAGGTVDLYQLPETLSQDVLTKMHAPAKDSKYPVLEDPTTLEQYDGFLFGIPTRYARTFRTPA